MSTQTVTMRVDVIIDPDITDGESVAAALDQLMETALSTPGILYDYGPVTIGEFVPTKLSKKRS